MKMILHLLHMLYPIHVLCQYEVMELLCETCQGVVKQNRSKTLLHTEVCDM